MKKWLVGAALLAALGGGYVGATHLSGGAYPTLGMPIGGDRALLRAMSQDFLEDIQFKDFVKAASYHAPELRDTVDIPFLLERLFMVKPEALDIMEYEVVFAKIDSTNLRARIKVRVKFKDLVRAKLEEREVVFYYHRETLDAPWYMQLESSLRQLEGAEGKAH